MSEISSPVSPISPGPDIPRAADALRPVKGAIGDAMRSVALRDALSKTTEALEAQGS